VTKCEADKLQKFAAEISTEFIPIKDVTFQLPRI
jgi:hypothetical protein